MNKKLYSLYLFIVFVVLTSLWALSYLSFKSKFQPENAYTFEGLSLLVVTILCCLSLAFSKDSKYLILPVVFTPFIYARQFSLHTIPTVLFISIGLLVISMIIHVIKFKPKLTNNRFMLGLVFLGIAFILGGFEFSSNYFNKNTVLLIFCGVGLFLLFLFISSTTQIDFKAICLIMTYLGLMLVIQLSLYFYIQDNTFDALFRKGSHVGWGISNNIAIILLFTSPFTLYLALKGNYFQTPFYLLLTVIQFCSIILTYSRGGVFSLCVGLVFIIPISIICSKHKIVYSLSGLIIVLTLSLLIYLLYKYETNRFDMFMDTIMKIDLKSLNGRLEIYKETIDFLKDKPLFGKGINYLFVNEHKYVWGHNTFVQTAKTMGIVGIFAITYHLLEKYFHLFKKMNLEKLTIIFGLGLSDIYGLMDVSYYFINYMVILIVILAVVHNCSELCLVKKE